MKRQREDNIDEEFDMAFDKNNSISNYERQKACGWGLYRILTSIAYGALDFITAGFYPSSSYSNSEQEWPDDFTLPNAPPIRVGDDVLFDKGTIQFKGTVKWCNQVLAGVEFQEPVGDCDGTLNGYRYFTCEENHGMFISPRYLTRFKKSESADLKSPEIANLVPSERAGPGSSDSAGLKSSKSVDLTPSENADRVFFVPKNIQNTNSNLNSIRPDNLIPVVQRYIPPISAGDFHVICGKGKGIQGQKNSCYMDTTLFSMFAFTDVCDGLLVRSSTDKDIPRYKEVQNVLREEIVNPLRKEFFVGAGNVMKLRRLLEELSTVDGLTYKQKDPEEFLRALLGDVLREEPFLKYNSGQNDYFYQLFVNKIGDQNSASIQMLLERSFEESKVKLNEVPRVLILQMPRYGNEYKMYEYVVPNTQLDITNIVESTLRVCKQCGGPSNFESRKSGANSDSYCADCFHNLYGNADYSEWKRLRIPPEYQDISDRKQILMDLCSVLCIKSVHYTSFAKCGRGNPAKWCYFDSMSEMNPFYGAIPEVTACPGVSEWLSADHFQDWRKLPDYLQKLLQDVSLCIYRSHD